MTQNSSILNIANIDTAIATTKALTINLTSPPPSEHKSPRRLKRSKDKVLRKEKRATKDIIAEDEGGQKETAATTEAALEATSLSH